MKPCTAFKVLRRRNFWGMTLGFLIRKVPVVLQLRNGRRKVQSVRPGMWLKVSSGVKNVEFGQDGLWRAFVMYRARGHF